MLLIHLSVLFLVVLSFPFEKYLHFLLQKDLLQIVLLFWNFYDVHFHIVILHFDFRCQKAIQSLNQIDQTGSNNVWKMADRGSGVVVSFVIQNHGDRAE